MRAWALCDQRDEARWLVVAAGAGVAGAGDGSELGGGGARCMRATVMEHADEQD
mgnify:CR=1 FL=1